MPVSLGIVNPPSNTSNSDATNVPILQGKQGEQVVTELSGRYYTQSYRGNVFGGFVTGVTVPQIANNLVSVCSLFNPASSNRNLVLIGADVGTVLATTVVDTIGLYFQKISGATTIPTSQTAGTTTNGLLGAGITAQGLFLSAATHVGTPTIAAIGGFFGAVTTTAAAPIRRSFDGEVILPPNTIVSFAMSTAASTASGIALGLQWMEVPL